MGDRAGRDINDLPPAVRAAILTGSVRWCCPYCDAVMVEVVGSENRFLTPDTKHLACPKCMRGGILVPRGARRLGDGGESDG